MERKEIEDLVISEIKRILKKSNPKDNSVVTTGTTLYYDIPLDSLDLLSLLEALGHRLDENLCSTELLNTTSKSTVADIVDFIVKKN